MLFSLWVKWNALTGQRPIAFRFRDKGWVDPVACDVFRDLNIVMEYADAGDLYKKIQMQNKSVCMCDGSQLLLPRPDRYASRSSLASADVDTGKAHMDDDLHRKGARRWR